MVKTTNPARNGFHSPAPSRNRDKVFVQFELDQATFLRVRRLARKAGCSPFEMCVTLLEEAASSASEPGRNASEGATNNFGVVFV